MHVALNNKGVDLNMSSTYAFTTGNINRSMTTMLMMSWSLRKGRVVMNDNDNDDDTTRNVIHTF